MIQYKQQEYESYLYIKQNICSKIHNVTIFNQYNSIGKSEHTDYYNISYTENINCAYWIVQYEIKISKQNSHLASPGMKKTFRQC